MSDTLAAANDLANYVPYIDGTAADIAQQIIDHAVEAHRAANALALGDISPTTARDTLTRLAESTAWNAGQLKHYLPPFAEDIHRPDILTAAHAIAGAVAKLSADIARAYPANQAVLFV